MLVLVIAYWRLQKFDVDIAWTLTALVIAKVFLSDMAELEGVLRALSFLGLGGALVGLGYAYRRLRPALGSPSQNIAA